jgi:hypothetical protein
MSGKKMKMNHWALLLSSAVMVGAQTTYDDFRIRSWAYPLGGWDMKNSGGYSNYIYVPGSTVPFGTDRIVGSKTIIYSDPASSSCGACAPEVHNFTRQSGYNNFNVAEKARSRSGGWTEFFRFNPGSGSTQDMLISLDWPCNHFTSTGACADKFFAAPGFQYANTRRFTNPTSNRGVLKVDYVCPGTCPSSNIKELWIKIPAWNMWSTSHKYFRLSDYGIPASSIVDMSATIHSDPGIYPPNTTSKIQVDDFEHIGPRSGSSYGVRPARRGRGGILWVGLGCGAGGFGNECSPEFAFSPAIHLYAGPGSNEAVPRPPQNDPKSSYRQTPYMWDLNSSQNPLLYKSTASPRGWVKLEYTGTASPVSQPMYMKSRAIQLGTWDMRSVYERSYPLPSDIQPNRIALISTTLQSDPITCGPGCLPGSKFTNFHRPLSKSGTSTGGDDGQIGGGLTYVDGNTIRLVMGKDPASPDARNYYEFNHSATSVGGAAYNRGWIRVDYAAAECTDRISTSAYTRLAIGFTGSQDDCHGNSGSGASGNHVMQTKGGSISNTSADAFYYAYRTSEASGLTATARVMELENTGSNAKTGVMIRANTSNTSLHASALVTGSGVQFVRRTSSGAAVVSTISGVTAPCWIRIVKDVNTFRAYYSLNNSTWTQIGPSASYSHSGTYNVGLAASSGGGLTTSGITNVSF